MSMACCVTREPANAYNDRHIRDCTGVAEQVESPQAYIATPCKMIAIHGCTMQWVAGALISMPVN